MDPQLVCDGDSELRIAISKKSLILVSSFLPTHQSATTQSYCYLSPFIVSGTLPPWQRMTPVRESLLARSFQYPSPIATNPTALFTGKLRHASILSHECTPSLRAIGMGV
jgi:hypothetical protein